MNVIQSSCPDNVAIQVVAKTVLAIRGGYCSMRVSPFDVGRDARIALAVWGTARGFLIGPKRAEQFIFKSSSSPLIAQ
jgi:hypothetical protein